MKEIKLDKGLLEMEGVSIVIVFGSYVTGLIHPESDIDIGVVFFDKSRLKGYPVEVYGNLRDEFTKRFEAECIDVVYLQESPLSLQYKAVTEGIVLFENTQAAYANYREIVIKKYLDFRFFEDIFNKAIIRAA